MHWLHVVGTVLLVIIVVPLLLLLQGIVDLFGMVLLWAIAEVTGLTHIWEDINQHPKLALLWAAFLGSAVAFCFAVFDWHSALWGFMFGALAVAAVVAARLLRGRLLERPRV